MYVRRRSTPGSATSPSFTPVFWVITVLLLASGLCAWMARDSHRDAVALRSVGAVPWQVTWMAHLFVVASAMIGLFAVLLTILCIPTE